MKSSKHSDEVDATAYLIAVYSGLLFYLNEAITPFGDAVNTWVDEVRGRDLGAAVRLGLCCFPPQLKC